MSKVYWDGREPLEVLKKLDFTAEKGQGIAILGPSGSGKTTFLNLLSGLDTPNEGRVRLAGVWLDGLTEEEKARFRNRHIGFVFQFYHLLSEFSAVENVMLPALIGQGISPSAARRRALDWLERVGLEDRAGHFPGGLSGGEQQRVAIARALMNDPSVLFCDEPTGNLDAEKGGQIAELLRDLYRRERKTVLIVTHDQRLARMADRVWNIVTGQWEEEHHESKSLFQ